MSVSRHFRLPAAFAVLLIAATILATQEPAIAQNLLRNGDFSEGSGNLPSYWYSRDWIDLPTTTFKWIPPSSGEPGMVVIQNQVENLASWNQLVRLDPGWYYVGAEVRSSCEGETRLLYGALVTLADWGIVSNDLKPSEDWQDLAFYVEVGSGGAQVRVQLQLACFPGFRKGLARFRGASVVKVDSPPPGAKKFHLDESRVRFGGRRWSIVLLLVSLTIAGAAGWIILPRTI